MIAPYGGTPGRSKRGSFHTQIIGMDVIERIVKNAYRKGQREGWKKGEKRAIANAKETIKRWEKKK